MQVVKCNKCKIDKPVDAFGLRNIGAGGKRRSSICKRCLGIDEVCRKFGLTPAEYHKLFEECEGLCSICRRECSSGRSLAVDHNHETGEVRGLLCGNCNMGLGMFKDDPGLLQAAIEYIQSW